MRRVILLVVVVAALTAGACRRPEGPDAFGNVEAIDVVVAAEASGRLVSFSVEEGQKLAAGATVGAIDSTELGLERAQRAAERQATTSRVVEVGEQVRVLETQRLASIAQRDAGKAQRASLAAQLEIARRTYDRTKRLFDQRAATAQQLDQAERESRVLEEQIRAQDQQIAAQDHQIAAQASQIAATRAQRTTATDQVATADAQIARVAERIRKSDVRNPVGGTVLATYAKTGEVVQPGQPLYKIADLSTVEVRAYLGEGQLASVHLGTEVQVTADAGTGRRTLPGSVSWISSQAEFTPTPIQTREERGDLVYAIKIKVANTGDLLKIGMPVDVRLAAGVAAQ